MEIENESIEVLVMKNWRYLIFCILVTYWATSFGQNHDFDGNISIEGVSKDAKNELVVMRLSDNSGEEFTAEFKSDKSEQILPSVLRQYLTDQEQQIKQMAEFIRVYLSLPENFYRERLGTQVELHYLIRKLADDFFTLDYYHRLPFDLKNKIMNAYFVKYPDSQVEFFRRYMNLPLGTSSEKIRADFSRLPKPYQIEITRLYEWDQKSWQGRLKESFARPMSSGMHGFPAQSALFGVAIGAVMATKMMTDYSANPAAFLQYIEGLDDPMTHISFFMFMAASGFTQDYLKTKVGGMNGSKNVRRMRAAIPYIGMSAGLIVSNLTHEVSSLLSACSDHLLKPSKPNKVGQPDPCDMAHDEFFNFENKVEMYIPMILSMTLSTAGLSYAQGLVASGTSTSYQFAKNLTGQMAGISKASGLPQAELVQERIAFNGKKARWFRSIKAKDIVKIAKNFPKSSKRIIGLSMNMMLTSRGWSFGPVAVAATLTAAIAQNYFFILVDTYLMPAINKGMAQVLRASFLNSSDKKMKTAITEHLTLGWQEKAKKCQPTGKPEEFSGSCENNLVDHIKDFQRQMNIWRTQNHSRFFTGVQVWGQIANTLLSEIYEANQFYNFYVNEVFNGFKFQNKLNNKQEIKPVEEPFNTRLLNRMTPLFGIKPLGHPECATGKAEKVVCVTDLQLYMNYPIEMEGYQRNRVQYVVNSFSKMLNLPVKKLPFEIKVKKTGIDVFDEENEEAAEMALKETSPELDAILDLKLSEKGKEIVTSILTQLATLDHGPISRAVIQLNSELASDSFTDQNRKMILAKINTMLGNPNPILVKGAILPYLYHESRKNSPSYSQVSRTAYGYSFKRHVEYLLFQMICGPESSSHNLTDEWRVNILGRELNLRPPQFNAPRLVKFKSVQVQWPKNLVINGPSKTNFCVPVVSKVIPFDSIYYAQFYVDGAIKPLSFFEMLNLNIRPEILGAWNSPSLDSTTNVTKWWDQNIEMAMKKLFERLDYNFQFLLTDLVQGLKADEKNLIKTTKASRSLLNSSIEELNVYLLILSEIEKAHGGEKSLLNLGQHKSLVSVLKDDPKAGSPSQNEIVSTLTMLIQSLRQIEVEFKDQQPVVTLGEKKQDLSQLKKQIDGGLKKYGAHLESLKIKEPYTLKVKTTAFEALSGGVSGLFMYLQNTQMVKYNSSEAVESLLSEENQKGQNKATVKSSSVPMMN